MLDVSTQAQILNLLKKLKTKFLLTYLFITHNLAIARCIGYRITVMYLGQIVEIVDKKLLLKNSIRPHTKALISAYPLPDPKNHGSQ